MLYKQNFQIIENELLESVKRFFPMTLMIDFCNKDIFCGQGTA